MGKGLIPIQAAKSISERYRAPIVIIWAIHPDQEHFTVTSYGQTKKLCKLGAGYAEQLSKSVFGAAEALQKEPDLPEEPGLFEGNLTQREGVQ